MGASANSRSPRGVQPLRRTMLVVTAVSSMNTRRVVSSQPCSRIQRRRARATSARLRSAARRLFFEGDAMASEEARKRAAAPGDTSPMQDRDDLIQCKVPLFADQGEDLLRILLQGGSAPATGHWFANPIFVKALHPADRRTGTDLELFSRLTSRSSCFNKVNYAYSQLTRVRSAHCPASGESMRYTRSFGAPWESRFTPVGTRCRSAGGTAMPRVLAVLRFITSSNFVGCKTGRSAGFAPFRMRPT